MSQDTETFVRDHALTDTVREISEAFERFVFHGIPIQKVEIRLTDEWDDDNNRLLITVTLGEDMYQAFHAWRDVRPMLPPAVAKAEQDGAIEFEFAPAYR